MTSAEQCASRIGPRFRIELGIWYCRTNEYSRIEPYNPTPLSVYNFQLERLRKVYVSLKRLEIDFGAVFCDVVC